MQFFVGVTDNDWFNFLAAKGPDELNFWRPSGKGFKAIEAGAPFLFKLHSPLNFIAGGGFFVRAENLPLSLAWDAFGEKNGASAFQQFRNLVVRHRDKTEGDVEICCIILNEPFFLPRDQWIPIPEDWSKNIVTGKCYGTDDPLGRRLWAEVQTRLVAMRGDTAAEEFGQMLASTDSHYGKEYLQRGRLGQGAFRVLVTSAYQRRCAVTGEKTLPVLQAAHIQSFAEDGPNCISNGLLLRSDLHILFDRGYMTVTPDYTVEISRRLKEDYSNGRDYYLFHGRKLATLPHDGNEQPGIEYLRWHNERVYLS